MKRLLLPLLLLPCLLSAQDDLLMLKKNGAHVATYATGMPLTMVTIYDQWFEGTITGIRHDSLFLNGMPFHYKEIKMIRRERKGLNYKTDGIILMIAGGGVLFLGAFNGLYRGDPPDQWYTATSFITAGALLVGGFVLTRLEFKKYVLGKKYTLEYYELTPNKSSHPSL